MNIKHILLSERSWSQKFLYCHLSFMTFWKRRKYRVGEQIGGGQGLTIKGKYKGSLKDDGTIWHLDSSGVYITNSAFAKTHRMVHHKE